MQNISIRYRTQSYSINIDPSKSVLELKTEVSNVDGISPDNFDLQVHKIIALDTKAISYYLNDGAIFTMVNVSIDVIVIINGENKLFCVNELKKVDEFVEEIILSIGHNTELSLFFNDIELVGAESLLSNGIVHNSTLTSRNGKPIINSMKRVTVTYRNEQHEINIDERKRVFEFKEMVSELTKIRVEHFCLRLDLTFLSDNKEMSTYIKDGENFLMTNVSIGVYVLVNGKEIWFYVKEDSKIVDFKNQIIRQAGVTGDISLEYYTGNLVGSSTVLESGLLNNTVLFAIMDDVIVSGMKKLFIIYRSFSYEVNINTSKTIYELKDEVSKLVDMKIKNFSLNIYWIDLEDNDKISDYMKYGPNIQMSKVVINVTVRLEGKKFIFFVEEDMKVDNFKMEIMRRSGKKIVTHLMYDGETLVGTKTLEENGVEHNKVIIACSTVTGG